MNQKYEKALSKVVSVAVEDEKKNINVALLKHDPETLEYLMYQTILAVADETEMPILDVLKNAKGFFAYMYATEMENIDFENDIVWEGMDYYLDGVTEAMKELDEEELDSLKYNPFN